MGPQGGRLPLDGIRIADLTLVLAGTGAASIMADWGAEVIRVEPINVLQPSTRGPRVHLKQADIDAARVWLMSYPDWTPGERPWNRYNFYHAHGRNKMSMSMDYTNPEGMRRFKELVRVSDIVMENNVPSTIEGLGLTYEELRKVKPDLVMLRMPAYGLEGPYRDYRSYGSHLEGSAGHTYIRGYADSDPSATEDIYYGDAVSAATGAVAVALGLRSLKRTGRGRLIEFAQVEGLIPAFGEMLLDFQFRGNIAQPRGNDLFGMAPHNAFQCQGHDRWVAIAVGNDEEWQGLVEVMGRPDWAKDARFATQPGRSAHREEIEPRITEWTLQRTNREAMEALQGHGVPAGVLNDDRDILRDPHFKARGFFQPFDHPDTGTNLYPGVVAKMKKTPNRVRFPPATLGEHNEYVYREVLGVPDEEYAALEDAWVIREEYQPAVP